MRFEHWRFSIGSFFDFLFSTAFLCIWLFLRGTQLLQLIWRHHDWILTSHPTAIRVVNITIIVLFDYDNVLRCWRCLFNTRLLLLNLHWRVKLKIGLRCNCCFITIIICLSVYIRATCFLCVIITFLGCWIIDLLFFICKAKCLMLINSCVSLQLVYRIISALVRSLLLLFHIFKLFQIILNQWLFKINWP